MTSKRLPAANEIRPT